MPNRRELVTTDMIECIVDKGNKFKDQNNTYSSMDDYLILGEQADFRRLKQVQESSYLRKYKTCQRNIDCVIFILDDFEFRGHKNFRINNRSNE